MKKLLLPLLTALALLLTALPALADFYPYVPWDTTIDGFLAAAEGTGLPFIAIGEGDDLRITLAKDFHGLFYGLMLDASNFECEFRPAEEGAPTLRKLAYPHQPLAMGTDENGRLTLPAEVHDVYEADFLPSYAAPDMALVWLPINEKPAAYQVAPEDAYPLLTDALDLALHHDSSEVEIAAIWDNMVFYVHLQLKGNAGPAATVIVYYFATQEDLLDDLPLRVYDPETDTIRRTTPSELPWLPDLSALSAPVEAETDAPELHTFAGVPWGSTLEDFLAAAEKAGFPCVAAGNQWAALPEGRYALFGMPMRSSELSVYFTRTRVRSADGKTPPAHVTQLERISASTDSLLLPKQNGEYQVSDAAGAAYAQILEKYSPADMAFVAVGSHRVATFYAAPAEELPYLLEDAILLCAESKEPGMVILQSRNVLIVFHLNTFSSSSDARINADLIWLDELWTASDILEYLECPPAAIENALPLPCVGGQWKVINIVP